MSLGWVGFLIVFLSRPYPPLMSKFIACIAVINHQGPNHCQRCADFESQMISIYAACELLESDLSGERSDKVAWKTKLEEIDAALAKRKNSKAKQSSGLTSATAPHPLVMPPDLTGDTVCPLVTPVRSRSRFAKFVRRSL